MVCKHEKKVFSPATHLIFDGPEVFTMEHMGYPKDCGVSPIAFSNPFSLFSKEAVEQMRQEVFEVRENHKEHLFSSDIAPLQLRGYASRFAPFTYQAWSHPETVAAISKVAGIEVVPWGNYEVAHINFSEKRDAENETRDELGSSMKRKYGEVETSENCYQEEGGPIVGWHRDSYPFVCILMLSDCYGMVGGETIVLTADGEIKRIQSPAMGSAVVLQGRHLTHKALRALGNEERITAVTSFRPRSSFVRDDTVLDTVRPVSDLSELYFEFAEYRLKMLIDRLQAKRRSLRAENRTGNRTMVTVLKNFLTEQEAFIAHTNHEIVPYDMVKMGCINEGLVLHASMHQSH